MMADRQPLSILDLATISGDDETEALQATVALAQQAEATGHRRVWYAEHHNLPTIASSATAVLIAHVAAHTSSIKLGSGGIMLPNHAPLVIAEQFGTLARLHPGRIELGLGRAPGTDQNTVRALRRDPRDAEHFPDDVLELQGFLAGESRIPGVRAIPGAGTNVPLYILGSSLFGASLAAHLGLPYAFASHFAPAALHDAVETYRREFEPSTQLEAPRVIAAANVIAADREFDAQQQFEHVSRRRVGFFVAGRRDLGDDELDRIVASSQGQQVLAMMKHSAIGTPDQVRTFLDDFAHDADADELIVVHASPTPEQRLRSVELTASAWHE
ncbi:MAG: LLM class flavin-dependent oxidoreductase [Acidimicrobiales bacterium]|nr:LLM class flavin-dependent oxidoreductase [Acidimicrobiales bacterium]